MWIIGYIFGLIFGIAAVTIHKMLTQAYGHVDVDPRTNQCKIHLDAADLSEKRYKYLVLKINHNVKIETREEDVL